MTKTILIGLLLAAGISTAEQPTTKAEIQPIGHRTAAAPFRLANASGKTIPLSKYRGQVVLLNFWATECGGCKQEIPWFMELGRKYKGKAFQPIGLSMDVEYEGLKGPDEAWARVSPFVRDRKLGYPILMADSAVEQAYKVETLPATFLIDKKGRIAATYAGVVNLENLEANLKALLGER